MEGRAKEGVEPRDEVPGMQMDRKLAGFTHMMRGRETGLPHDHAQRQGTPEGGDPWGRSQHAAEGWAASGRHYTGQDRSEALGCHGCSYQAVATPGVCPECRGWLGRRQGAPPFCVEDRCPGISHKPEQWHVVGPAAGKRGRRGEGVGLWERVTERDPGAAGVVGARAVGQTATERARREGGARHQDTSLHYIQGCP